MDFIDQIIAYESGELSNGETLELFAKLIKSGQCWTLQGHYSKTAAVLIEVGYISRQGEILKAID